MTDEAPVEKSNPPNDVETWVTVLFGSAERAPGVDDASTTTYREPAPDHRRRPFLIGGAVVLAVVAVVAVIALSAGTGGETGRAAAGRHRTRSRVVSTPTSRSTTSTTWATPATSSSSTVPTTVQTTAPPATTATTATTAAPPPTPRATADSAQPAYQPEPLPAGVGASITGCSWQPTAAGRYQATGTLTNGPSTARGWTITIHWLQNGREVGRQSAVVDPGPGGAKAWSLALGAPTPPADPFSCALSVA